MSTEFRATGRGNFPLDMLRYDCCYPAQPADVEAMRGNSRTPLRTVTLFTTNKRGPTLGRWASFGWPVRNDEPRGMKYFALLYYPVDYRALDKPLLWLCWADDLDHAEAQLEDAKPDVRVVWSYAQDEAASDESMSQKVMGSWLNSAKEDVE